VKEEHLHNLNARYPALARIAVDAIAEFTEVM
jgi:hypothetical protein